MYKYLIKPLLFRFSPEKAHALTVAALNMFVALPFGKAILKALFVVKKKQLERELFGLTFPNPVGLAAGFDKDGKYLQSMACLGFGFIEVGTVTPKPQAGNPAPRLFRLPQSEGLINRMGFNNKGVDALAARLKTLRADGSLGKIIIGGNIGKNKDTPNEEALRDYLYCFERLFEVVDYFVVNVSSPNTPGLRELQDKALLLDLLAKLQTANLLKRKPKPILLKIAPDLNINQLNDIIDVVKQTSIAGVVATNTTISREGLSEQTTQVTEMGIGGLSGKPLEQRSTEVIRYLYEKSGGALNIIGVGGVDSFQTAKEKLDAGAKLIQIYTGLIYEGPGLIKKINRSI